MSGAIVQRLVAWASGVRDSCITGLGRVLVFNFSFILPFKDSGLCTTKFNVKEILHSLIFTDLKRSSDYFAIQN
jgi:hypothetical protein